MKTLFLLAPSLVLALLSSTVLACAGNEYWQDDPKGTPVWTARNEVEVEKAADSRVTDNLLRAALSKSGLRSCSGVEKDLVDADVKRAIRTDSFAVTKHRRWANYQEITQVLIRHRLRGQTGAVLEIMTRTKVCMQRGGRFMPAPLDYQQDAVLLANKVADNLTALLSR
jgi:hypothetical protein